MAKVTAQMTMSIRITRSPNLPADVSTRPDSIVVDPFPFCSTVHQKFSRKDKNIQLGDYYSTPPLDQYSFYMLN
jgi:hypothetical protein